MEIWKEIAINDAILHPQCLSMRYHVNRSLPCPVILCVSESVSHEDLSFAPQPFQPACGCLVKH